MYTLALFHVPDFLVSQITLRFVVIAPGITGIIINGYPKVPMYRVITMRRYHGEAGHQELGNTPVVLIVLCITMGTDKKTFLPVYHLEDWLQVIDVVLVASRTLEKWV